MSLKRLFFILFFLNAAASIFLVLVIKEHKASTQKLEQAYEMRYKSLILADELRQSSDDLTRLARTYVLTGDPLFENQYMLILKIRNGEHARPLNYNGIFWDFYTIKTAIPYFDGEKISLKRLMKQANFPDEELSLLFKSQYESDDLTTLETKAMNAVKGLFQDKQGNYSIHKNPNFKLARELMHSDEYHNAKIRIMKPLDDFYRAFEKRTQLRVQEAHNYVKQLESFVNMVVLISIALFVMSFGVILSHIVFPLDDLRSIMNRLSKNDMSIVLKRKAENNEIEEMLQAIEIFRQNTYKLINSEAELKIAIDNANNANRAKSVFLAKMSHELRTPLNSILGFASLLSKSNNISDNERNNLQTIKKSGEHLLAIINEILELSKIEAGKITIINQQFSFFEMLQELHALFEYRCKLKGLSLLFQIDENIPNYIVCDEKRLKQILINLLSNALKFTQYGGITLRSYSKNCFLHFEVADTGIGIQDDNLDAIFNPFEQVKQTTYNETGTGLGLSISKELIFLMKGKIFVQSEIGIGTTFEFFIRFTAGKFDGAKDTKIIPSTNINKKKTQSLNIGIIDDNKDNLRLLSEYLLSHNLNVLQFENGFSFMEYIKTNHFDMVFIDLLMPQLNGLELMYLLQEHFARTNQNMKIVIFSANVFDDDKDKVLDKGADYFLGKPFEEFELLNILNHAFDLDLQTKPDIERTFLQGDDHFELDKKLALKVYHAALKMDGDAIKKSLDYIQDEKTKMFIQQYVDDFNFKILIQKLEKLISI